MSDETGLGARRAGTGPLAGAGRPVTSDIDVVVAGRRDRVRWGPVWAGVIISLPVFLLLEFVLFALGGLTLGLDPDASGTTAGWLTGLIALIAFFIGGLTAGASALWKGATDGLFHGVMVWALGLVAMLFLTLLGGSALLGPVSDLVTQVGGVQQQFAQSVPNIDADAAMSTARAAAGWAILGLVLSLIAAGIGGMCGSRMWRHGDDAQGDAVEVR